MTSEILTMIWMKYYLYLNNKEENVEYILDCQFIEDSNCKRFEEIWFSDLTLNDLFGTFHLTYSTTQAYLSVWILWAAEQLSLIKKVINYPSLKGVASCQRFTLSVTHSPLLRLFSEEKGWCPKWSHCAPLSLHCKNVTRSKRALLWNGKGW